MIKELANGRIRLPTDRSTDLFEMFCHFQDSQLAMCSELETIADCLPNILNKDVWLKTAQSIFPLLSKAHGFEELELFPAILERKKDELRFEEVIKRLQSEHHNDEDYAESVAHAIRCYVRDDDHSKAEGLSWMLRGFFESTRRHIAFEREHILPCLNLQRHSNKN